MVEKTRQATEAEDRGSAESGRQGTEACRDMANLLQWKGRAGGHGTSPPEIPGWREKVRRFSRKEKQAVLLGLLLSDRTVDEQLDAMIEAVMVARSVARSSAGSVEATDGC
ncbi:MAG TPA: hypothetical protein VI756_22810 [Blastocatellia bacterium]